MVPGPNQMVSGIQRALGDTRGPKKHFKGSSRNSRVLQKAQGAFQRTHGYSRGSQGV